MNHCILFRGALAEESELAIARKYCRVVESRSLVHPGETVIGRYSVLPFYQELVSDLEVHGASLINSYAEHCYVADIRNWYPDFVDVTPLTWESIGDIPASERGPFVLKGCTNSRKQLWQTHMFAQNREEMQKVWMRLLDDTMIGGQGIVFRKYEPFESFGTGINGVPITNEWRYFVLYGRVIARGFYWSEHPELLQDPRELVTRDELTRDKFAEEMAKRIRIPFAVIDVARHIDGNWRVVELNDGQMSGVSCINVELLYKELGRLQQTI